MKIQVGVMASALAFTMVMASPSLAKDEPPPIVAAYTPATTTVMVLPVINCSHEKDKKQRALQAAEGTAELQKIFVQRGFNVVDDAAMNKALADEKIDLNDQDNQIKPVFYRLGKDVNADLVAFARIDEAAQHTETSIFMVKRVGVATVTLWLVNSKTETPILNAVSKQAKSHKGIFEPRWEGASANIIAAVAGGIRDLLKPFTEAYPELKKQK